MIPEDAIRLRSYLIWQRSGCPEGKSHEHWLQAERELEAEHRAWQQRFDDCERRVVARPMIRPRPQRLTAVRLRDAEARRLPIAARQ
ncbi:DUF2934 domain-containing protein [Reyranella sp.]|uniref:DUF2934 domain-containing protein n=1 Tax=Reyranella sp. TaxID=1929291 RepID=UPI003BA9C148